MRVIASSEATGLIHATGGRLYVWPHRPRCCGAVTVLRTSSRPPRGTTFRQLAVDGFDLHVPAGLARLPEELHLEVRRFPRRVEAYWNGCAWLV
jgi:hypothetical protein